MRTWSFALSKVEVFGALVEHIEKTRGVKLPITGDGLIHFVTHHLDGTYEFYSTPMPVAQPRKPFRWFWQSRDASKASHEQSKQP